MSAAHTTSAVLVGIMFLKRTRSLTSLPRYMFWIYTVHVGNAWEDSRKPNFHWQSTRRLPVEDFPVYMKTCEMRSCNPCGKRFHKEKIETL
jgi:hypothetical protein